MTKIDEKYMDIKPQTNMHISEGWRACIAMIDCLSRFIIHFRTNLGATHTFQHKFVNQSSDVFGVTLQCK